MRPSMEGSVEADARRREAVRAYALGELCWRDLQAMGIERWTLVLSDLADMGLDVPVAPLEGRNADLRRKGIAWLDEALTKGESAP